jgi:hypothetical protein
MDYRYNYHLSCRRVAWVIVVGAALCGFGYLVHIKLTTLKANQKTVNVEVNYNESLTFPALTICNQNKFRSVGTGSLPLTFYLASCVLNSLHTPMSRIR